MIVLSVVMLPKAYGCNTVRLGSTMSVIDVRVNAAVPRMSPTAPGSMITSVTELEPQKATALMNVMVEGNSSDVSDIAS